MFVAVRGLTSDGHNFINDAKKRGASYIYDGPDGRENLENLRLSFTEILHKNLKLLELPAQKAKLQLVI